MAHPLRHRAHARRATAGGAGDRGSAGGEISSGRQEGPAHGSFGETWRATASGLGRDLWRPLAQNGPLTLAVGGVVLYLIGVVRMAGILRAEDIPVSRGLPIVQLQDYPLKGLSVVTRPQLLLLLGIALLLVTLVLASADLKKTNPEFPGFFELDAFAGLYVILLTALTIAVVPVADWASMLPGLAVSVACLSSLNRQGRKPGSNRTRLAFGVFLGIALALGMRAYFSPPPLDYAVLKGSPGEAREGKLLYQSGSAVFLVGPRNPSGFRAVEMVPISSLTSVVIRDGENRNFKTAPELLDLRFYRLWENEDSGLQFEPSP